MIYNEQQFERFSKPPFKYERKQVIDTHTEIRKAIDTYFDKQAIQEKYGLGVLPELDPFLQGSYANGTNITQSSDVDIVIRITNVWRSNKDVLSPADLERYSKTAKTCNYSFKWFNQDILECLQKHFGNGFVVNDPHCLTLRKHSKFCDADIIPAFTYKLFGTYPSEEGQRFNEGITFDRNDGKTVINFPKLHKQALIAKSDSTDGNFKETVRMFKNLKDELIDHGKIADDTAKSYYIENLLFNVHHDLFYGTYKERFLNILEKLIVDFNDNSVAEYYCANGIHKLIAENNWQTNLLKQFLIALSIIRDKNEF